MHQRAPSKIMEVSDESFDFKTKIIVHHNYCNKKAGRQGLLSTILVMKQRLWYTFIGCSLSQHLWKAVVVLWTYRVTYDALWLIYSTL